MVQKSKNDWSASQITGNDTLTIQDLTKNQHAIPSLHEEVMKIEGF